MNKKIVWDLFGGGQNSVYNALDKNEYDVYTFDLVPEPEHNKQFVIDLAQDFHNLKEYFSKLPKPDIIVASPLCQSFSSILTMKGGGLAFELMKIVQKPSSLKEALKSLKN